MRKNTQIITTALAIVALGGVAWAALNTPDDRSVGEHVEDAVNDLDKGVDDAFRELEDRTPLERVDDSYNDATDGDVE